MNRRLINLLLLGAVACYGADVSGKWVGKVPARGDAVETTFDLKQAGAKLTGTMTASDRVTPIQDGKVEGDTLSFFVMQTGGNATPKINFKGTVSGAEIKFTRQREGGDPREFTAKRAGS